MNAIELHGVAKRFGDTTVLVDVELSVPAGSFTAILGSSGSGKTTMMRLIAGFEGIDAGTLAVGGRIVDDGRRVVRPQHRGVGYVPQDGALFPHLTVAANVGFGLARRERPRALALLQKVGLAALAHRYPHQLSGGEQQRVALARALAVSPSVVLLDEPFNALDAALRTELGRELAEILAQDATTTVLVTHDRSEALALADQIAVLDGGRIAAVDEPRTLYGSPADLFTATSVGEANILAAEFDGASARCALGAIPLLAAAPRAQRGAQLLLLRPEQLKLALSAGEGAVPATIDALYYHGHDALAYVRLAEPAAGSREDRPGGSEAGSREGALLLLARVPGTLAAARGQRVWVSVRGPGRAVPAGPQAEHGAGLI